MGLQIAMVAFPSLPKLEGAGLVTDFAQRWPDVPAPAEVATRDDMLAFRASGWDVVLMAMPAPIPWSELEGPCATSILWPRAADELMGHGSHVIVTVRGGDDRLELSTMLTRVTASLLAAQPPALGVYWGNSTLVVPRQLFVEMATEVLPEGPPIPIWVDFRVGSDGDGVTGFTQGMAALGHMELEAVKTPETVGGLRERLMSLAGYLLEKGPVIRDGDTFGEDANERIRIVFGRSSFGAESDVMQLIYAPDPKQKKPWYRLW